MRQRLPRRIRLRRRADFLRVQRAGRKHHTRHFLVFVARAEPTAAGLPPARFGVTVTRKVGGAVARNRIKRLVRELFRRNAPRFPPGLDIVWVAKHDAAEIGYAAVEADFEHLLGRSELVPRG
jgi:ribonuclease P protein component